MGEMSVAAHKDGFLVTLVPPESYLDASTSDYDRSLTHSYPEPWHPEFKYHGHNVYAYLLAKYKLATFDLIDIQLYETYSHATYFIDQVGIAPAGEFLDVFRLFWSLPSFTSFQWTPFLFFFFFFKHYGLKIIVFNYAIKYFCCQSYVYTTCFMDTLFFLLFFYKHLCRLLGRMDSKCDNGLENKFFK